MTSVPQAKTAEQDNVGWMAALLQLNDTFYPTGAYAHSFGLEGLIAEAVVKDRETLRNFLNLSVLPSLRRNELPLVAQAYRSFGVSDWDSIAKLCELASATKSSRELRFANENIGRQRAELAVRLHASPLAEEYVRRCAQFNWPHSSYISAGLEAHVIRAPIGAALSAVYYGTLATLIAAAMKLLRLGQNGAQTLLTELMSRSSGVISVAMEVPIEEIGWYNPWLDIAAARHEKADARLFIS